MEVDKIVCVYQRQDIILQQVAQILNDAVMENMQQLASFDTTAIDKLRDTVFINSKVRVTSLRNPQHYLSKHVTCLSIACRYARIDDVKWLVSHPLNADVTVRGDAGETALHDACMSKFDTWQKISYLISKERHLLCATTNNGTLPVHIASRRRNPEALRTLLEYVDDWTLNTKTKLGLTPLHVSVHHVATRTLNCFWHDQA